MSKTENKWAIPKTQAEVHNALITDLIPPRNELPEEFRDGWHSDRNIWCAYVSNLFFNGGTWLAKPRKGIDSEDAFVHFRTVLGSYAPSHEHKIGALGYLLSLWFKNTKQLPESDTREEGDTV